MGFINQVWHHYPDISLYLNHLMGVQILGQFYSGTISLAGTHNPWSYNPWYMFQDPSVCGTIIKISPFTYILIWGITCITCITCRTCRTCRVCITCNMYKLYNYNLYKLNNLYNLYKLNNMYNL